MARRYEPDPGPKRVDLDAYRKFRVIRSARHAGPRGAHDRPALLLRAYGVTYSKINHVKKNFLDITTELFDTPTKDLTEHHDFSLATASEAYDKLEVVEQKLYDGLGKSRFDDSYKQTMKDFAEHAFAEAAEVMASVLERNPEFQAIIERNRPTRNVQSRK